MPTDCMCKDRCRHGKTCNVMGKKGIWLQTRTMSCSAFDEIIEQTNEEWLRGLGTRELAKELALLVLYDMPLYDRLHNVFEGGESAVIDECEKWLKEKHE